MFAKNFGGINLEMNILRFCKPAISCSLYNTHICILILIFCMCINELSVDGTGTSNSNCKTEKWKRTKAPILSVNVKKNFVENDYNLEHVYLHKYFDC